MNILGALVVFVCFFFLALFMLLPIGAAPPAQPQEGHAPSAPQTPRIGRKALIAALAAVFLTILFYLGAEYGPWSFRNLD